MKAAIFLLTFLLTFSVSAVEIIEHDSKKTLVLDNKKEIDFKNRIYELVKIQYYKDNNNTSNYYSVSGDKFLAACLDWASLSSLYNNNNNKYYKKIMLGSSYGDNSSKNKATKNCQLRANNNPNCICQIVDNKNMNSVIIPDIIYTKLKLVKNNSKLALLETSKTKLQDKKIQELNKLYDENLISIDDYNNKKNQILGIEVVNKKIINTLEDAPIQNNDKDGPTINIAKVFKSDEDLTALIEGNIFDVNEVVYIVVDGNPVSLKNGKFSQRLFVKPEGQDILITAMDKFGNKTNTSVTLKRSKIIAKPKTIDYLNPTIIKTEVNQSSVAIIIGIENYQNTFAAPFAKNDALAFNDFVHTSLGVPKQNIKLLMDDEAGRTNTLKALVKWLPNIVIEDKSDIFIFFSGHGLASEDGEDLYLLPSDGDPELLLESTIMRNQLFDRIAKLNPLSVTVFLDTCYSGATRSDELLVASKPIFIEAKEQDIPSKFTVFSASAGRETAKVLEEAEHGLFSYYMMKGLEGDADVNNDNQITNGELIAFVNKNVSRQANQTPQLNGDPDQVLVQW